MYICYKRAAHSTGSSLKLGLKEYELGHGGRGGVDDGVLVGHGGAEGVALVDEELGLVQNDADDALLAEEDHIRVPHHLALLDAGGAEDEGAGRVGSLVERLHEGEV